MCWIWKTVIGIVTAASKSTLAKANEKRDWRIFQDFGLKLTDRSEDSATAKYSYFSAWDYRNTCADRKPFTAGQIPSGVSCLVR
jgi:hypothetical protein